MSKKRPRGKGGGMVAAAAKNKRALRQSWRAKKRNDAFFAVHSQRARRGEINYIWISNAGAVAAQCVRPEWKLRITESERETVWEGGLMSGHIFFSAAAVAFAFTLFFFFHYTRTKIAKEIPFPPPLPPTTVRFPYRVCSFF